MRRIVSVLMALTIIFGIMALAAAEEIWEDEEEVISVLVTATRLNGRAKPRKSSRVEAIFDYGDTLYPTGKWSKNHEWIEVEGGETGTVWVSIQYVTEEMRPREMRNAIVGRIKIRKKPINGKLAGYLGEDKTVMIDRILLGWGHCEKGWINMDYLEEVIYE